MNGRRILGSDMRVVGSQTREGVDLLAALEERRASDLGATIDRSSGIRRRGSGSDPFLARA